MSNFGTVYITAEFDFHIYYHKDGGVDIAQDDTDEFVEKHVSEKKFIKILNEKVNDKELVDFVLSEGFIRLYFNGNVLEDVIHSEISGYTHEIRKSKSELSLQDLKDYLKSKNIKLTPRKSTNEKFEAMMTKVQSKEFKDEFKAYMDSLWDDYIKPLNIDKENKE